MTKKRDKLIIDAIDANGCLAFPFTLLGITFSENTAYGAAVKKLAADNGRLLCSEPKTLQMTLVDACDLDVDIAVVKASSLGAYILDNEDTCIPGHLVCVVRDDTLVGACKEYDFVKGLGTSCSC